MILKKIEKSDIKPFTPKDEVSAAYRYGEYYIIVFNLPETHNDANRNVSMFDSEGNFVWKIDEVVPKDHAAAPFMNLYEENDVIYAGNWVGLEVIIDLKSGKRIGQKPGKLW